MELVDLKVDMIVICNKDYKTIRADSFMEDFAVDVTSKDQKVIAPLPATSSEVIKLVNADGTPNKAGGGVWQPIANRILPHFSIKVEPIIIPVILKFNIADIIGPTSVEDMLLAGHSTNFMLDARECNFQIYEINMAGDIKLKRVDNKLMRDTHNTYPTHVTMINNCFELVESKQQSNNSRFSLITE